MIVWMLWSIAFAMLIGVAAVALERVAVCFRLARRHIWMVAVVAAAVIPPILATQRNAATAAPQDVSLGSVSPPGASRPVSVLDGTLNLRRVPPVRDVPAGNTSEPFPDRWVLFAWLAASLMLAGFFARTMFRLRYQSVAWPETEVESYRALVAPNAGPAVIGFTRPRIVIPEWALSLDRSERELMLRHEMEHIRAHDPRTLLMAGALLVVFPWNVALWLIVRQLRRAMELDCDARVIRAVGNPSEYGRVLLAVGERYTSSLPLAAALSEPRPLLEQRIDAMTAPRPRRPFRAALPFLALALLATVAATRAPRPTPLPPLVFARANAPAPPAAQAPARPQVDLKHGLDLQSGMHLELRDTVARSPAKVIPPAVMERLDREGVVALARENFPAVARGEVPADFVLMLFDAHGNYLTGFAGQGPVAIRVRGDTLTPNQRRALQQASQGGATGGAGRGGRGGGGTASASDAPRRNDYLLGFGMTITLGADSTRRVAPTNVADGLTAITPDGDESGISGIPATHVSHVDQFSFDGPAQRVKILAVHLTSAPDADTAAQQVLQVRGERQSFDRDTVQVADTSAKKKAKVKQLVVLPMPLPDSLKPLTMEACFDVASNGDAKLLTVTRTKDYEYNRKIEASLRGYGFTPATRNGVAVRDTVCVKAIAR